ncbi:MAG: 30S ribosomal protein S20 [Armatimonadota bacterium]|nr:30S ribosomal protein S20 [Armatimonadota bacterium]
MPNIKSVAKDVKKSHENRLRNLAAKSKIKTFVKKTKGAADSGDIAAAKQLVIETESIVDNAAKRGIIHKNAAARRKSRIMKKVNKAAG